LNEINTIIIDFGGVILRTEDRSPRTSLAQKFGLTYPELDDIVFSSESSKQAALGKISSDQQWNHICSELHIDPIRKDQFIAEFFAGDQLDWELIRFIKDMRKKFRTALLSNAWDDLRYHLEFEWKLSQIFDFMVISAEVGLAKPDPKIFEFTLTHLGVKASEAVFIDDFLENIFAAQNLGMSTIHFQSSYQVIRELKKMFDGVE
jgi:epoxide hydrolase-like predicted phosphatase